MSREHKKISRTVEKKTAKDVELRKKVIDKGKKLKEDMDKLMDEIDDVLEENAEEFVKNFVQKGWE